MSEVCSTLLERASENGNEIAKGQLKCSIRFGSCKCRSKGAYTRPRGRCIALLDRREISLRYVSYMIRKDVADRTREKSDPDTNRSNVD